MLESLVPKFPLSARRLYLALVPIFAIIDVVTGITISTEFAGGSVTGPILSLALDGRIAVLAGLLLCGWWPRVAAGLSLIGIVLCLPLFTYGLLPGFYRWMFPGVYSVRESNFFVFDPFRRVGFLRPL